MCANRFRRQFKALIVTVVLLLSCCPLVAYAQQPYGPSGYPSLVYVPTADFPDAGTMGLGVSIAPPYNTLYLSAQPADWLHVGAKYTAITNRRYSDFNDQSFKDKSFDVAVRLIEESDYWPSLVVGLNDFGGTGFFSSEYIVATRNFWDVSVTLGLGFGRFGTYSDLSNPFVAVFPSMEERELGPNTDDNGGVPALGTWFTGRNVSVIGGVEWAPRYSKWSVQLELDGNDYTAEASTEPLDVKSRINIGTRYQLPGSWYAGLAYVRGDAVVGQIGLAPRIGRNESSSVEPLLPAGMHLRHPDYLKHIDKLDTTEGASALVSDLDSRGVYLHAVNIDSIAKTLTIWESNAVSEDPVDTLRVVGRTAVARLPGEIDTIEIVEVSGGLEVGSFSAPATLLDAESRGDASVDEVRAQLLLQSNASSPRDKASFDDLLNYPTWVYGANPAIRSNIGGLDGFYFGQLLIKPFATLQLTPGLSATAVGAISIISNLDELEQRDSSSLPNVRSRLEQYQSTSDDWYIDTLEFNYLFPLAEDWFGRVSGGIFEEMFGGIAGEVLYRPISSRLAYGLNLNYVKQRDYDQRLEFLDYSVVTGHFSVYYNTPFDGLVIKTSAGKYLAGDVGVTLDVSRVFDNGVVMGAFATKTDVSSEEFGEGSFDKGIYLRIPFSIFYRSVNKGAVSFDYRFLSRDGGQKVRDGRPLYGSVGYMNAGAVYGP